MKIRIILSLLFLTIYSLSYSQVTLDDKITKLLAADQAVRNSSKTRRSEIGISDRNRRKAVMKLIKEDAFENPNSYANAGVIMHHSNEINDIIMARELFILSAYLRGQYSSLTALAEDKLLIKIGRLQRFGSQYSVKNQLDLVREVECGDWSVTDDLRADYLLPPLESVYRLGVKVATEKFITVNLQRLDEMLTPTGWVGDLTQSTVHSKIVDLNKILKSPGKEEEVLACILRLYRSKNTWMPSDYCMMAELLIKTAKEPSQLLLANELAALSVMRMYEPGWRVYAISWDRFAQSIGLSVRYEIDRAKDGSLIVPKVLYYIQQSKKCEPVPVDSPG